MEGIAIALSCSLAWGLSDFWAGAQSRRHPFLAILLGAQLAACALGVVVVGVVAEPVPIASRFWVPLLSGLLLALTLASLFRALSLTAMGVVAPIVAVGAVIPVLVGVFQGDRLGGLQITGIAACILGVILASREDVGRAGPNSRAGVAFAFAAMVGAGTFLVLFDASAKTSLPWTVALTRSGALIGALALIVCVRPVLTPGTLARGVPVGLLDICAYTAFGLAATRAPLSVVAVLASLYPAVTVVLARALLGEELGRVRLAGVALALTGVGLLVSG